MSQAFEFNQAFDYLHAEPAPFGVQQANDWYCNPEQGEQTAASRRPTLAWE